ncbi:hypothetical protein JYU12_02975 [bacterium AH-315-K03]|nr:hypothetical protein [bacterium AH-315-K03]
MFVFTLEEVQVERGLDAANSLAPGNNDRPKGEAVIGGYLGERLAAILKKTGYCREGFMEFDRNIAKDVSIIRGECYEPATDEDRKNFING